MAVVTHGGSLPDSSQKTDFYSLIDNATVSSIVGADISSSAGILDSQLNTISTAGKVNTSALTGQIANANLAQLTTPALVSGAALTLLGNIPSGAGTIPNVNLPMTILAAHSTTTQSISGTGYVQRTGFTADLDTGSYLSSNVYTPQVAGWYLVIYFDAIPSSGGLVGLSIYKNGAAYVTNEINPNNTADAQGPMVFAIIQMNGSTDSLSFYVKSGVGSVNMGGTGTNYVGIIRVY